MAPERDGAWHPVKMSPPVKAASSGSIVFMHGLVPVYADVSWSSDNE